MISTSPTLRHFDPFKEVTVTADASQYGLGAALLQEGRPVCYSSRSLNKAERNYAQIEKETLAVVFTCEKYHQYIYGRKTEVESDHKPLEYIFKKPLEKCPPRIQRLVLRLQKYDIHISYKPGKDLVLADTLSRDPKRQTDSDDDHVEVEQQVHFLCSNLSVSKQKQEEIRMETQNDNQLQILINTMREGWPGNRQEVLTEVREFWDVREDLTTMNGMIFKGEQILCPSAMRSDMLRRIHEGHLRIEKCKRRARDVMYWPRMSAEISDLISRCSICLNHRNTGKRRNHSRAMTYHQFYGRKWHPTSSQSMEKTIFWSLTNTPALWNWHYSTIQEAPL
ncbi:transposon ty3-i Gag-Pol polyprotein [Plakobranchus ocellatus]|uniref:Transposon ty3-i Gag-Pol polyprotein n=1 Tax=Plakobranchus ocellatus TaxID=259542 RepID=A0AAV4A0S1_9GAST|nr:transposon ty3-i Gag-Pol polyprotein [Plakobranchus ocellatus]